MKLDNVRQRQEKKFAEKNKSIRKWKKKNVINLPSWTKIKQITGQNVC